jgi:hypothetical protein
MGLRQRSPAKCAHNSAGRGTWVAHVQRARVDNDPKSSGDLVSFFVSCSQDGFAHGMLISLSLATMEAKPVRDNALSR